MRREEMPTIQVRKWTREEYDRMVEAGVLSPEDHVELIDGEILQVTPQGSRHATAISLCQRALAIALSDGYLVRSQLPLALDDISEPEPDIAVVPGFPRDYRDAHPASGLLIVEVADATLEFDRERKGSLYARAGIAEYWIVNLIDEQLEVYRGPKLMGRDPMTWGYQSYECFGTGQSVSPLFDPRIQIAVAELLP